MPSNPFSTRFIRPGAIEFLFPQGLTAEKLVETLRKHAWQGQIIGPHGSGKSTLVAALAPASPAAGRKVRRQGPGGTSHEPEARSQTSEAGSQRRGDGSQEVQRFDTDSLDAETQVIFDGFEQLRWWSRRKLRQVCRAREAGLLVTAHRDMGLPTLWRTEPSLELTCTVVARLLPSDDSTVTLADIAGAFEATGGNLRETLFALYDVYQQRRAKV